MSSVGPKEHPRILFKVKTKTAMDAKTSNAVSSELSYGSVREFF